MNCWLTLKFTEMEKIKSMADYTITVRVPQSATKAELYEALKEKIDLTFAEKTEDDEIPFGAKDSELKGGEYTIPKGMEAEIKDGKVVVREKESEDERVRKEIIGYLNSRVATAEETELLYFKRWLAYLEKLKEQKPAEWSEEDELMRSACIAFIQDEKFKGYERSYECVDWLKSLRPQPKREWGEKDKEIIGNLRHVLNAYAYEHNDMDVNGDYIEQKYIDADNWLKSL